MIISGSIEEIRFVNEDNGYHIMVLDVDGMPVIAVGTFPPVTEGETLKLSGEFVTHPKFGRQFKSERAERVAPDTIDGVFRFLSSGIIKGLGPKTAAAITDRFGVKALDILENRPAVLSTVRGISEAKAKSFGEEYKKYVSAKDSVMFLQNLDISLTFSLKVFKAYGQDTKTIVAANPYRLIEDIDGIGFLTADRIAQKLGIEKLSPFRLRAGILCALNESGTRDGNTFLYRSELINQAADLLSLAAQPEMDKLLTEAVDELIIQNKLKCIKLPMAKKTDKKIEETSAENLSENFTEFFAGNFKNSGKKNNDADDGTELMDAIFLRPAYSAESSAALKLVNLKNNFRKGVYIGNSADCADGIDNKNIENNINIKNALTQDLIRDIDEYGQIYGIKLNDEQKNAAITALINGISIITGGPGTGKTTIIKCLLYLFEKRGESFILMAPTGRAAKRINESTGKEASTIHRALKLPAYGDEMPTQLTVDNVIVDEVSMMDIYLFSSLLKCIRDGTRLILLGDKDQLPSVGAGNVLSDILERISKVILKTVYRQGKQSLIIHNAHLINAGEMPQLDFKDGDFFFINQKTAADIAKTVTGLVRDRLPVYLNTLPSKIQVLCPMKNGDAGTKNLNEMLSVALNSGDEIGRIRGVGDFGGKNKDGAGGRGDDVIYAGGCAFKEGDKVMQTSNNYSQSWSRGRESGEGVFNGDMGIVESVILATRELTVLFEDGRRAVYTDNIDELTLAYAITVHKSQGSEFEAVVMPVLAGSPVILTRNLLYTAVTRAKRLVVLVGEKYAVKRMVDNNYIAGRNSALKHFIDIAEKNYHKLFGLPI